MANGAAGPVFNYEDWLVVAAFIAVMLAIVLLAMRKKARSGKDYFLSSRDSNWLQIGTSIFSSNIGSEHLVGLAGAGFATGMAMAHWEIQSWLILVLGWVFVPLYDRMKVFTMPEFLELRFSRGSRNVLSLLTIASLVLTKIAVTIYAGDVVVRTLLGIDTVDVFGLRIDVFWVIAPGPRLHDRALYRARRLAGHHVHRRAAGAGADRGLALHPLRRAERARPWRSHRRLARDGRGRGREDPPDPGRWTTRTGLGPRCCRARRSSGSGIGARTSTSSSACSRAGTSSNRAAAPSWRRSSS